AGAAVSGDAARCTRLVRLAGAGRRQGIPRRAGRHRVTSEEGSMNSRVAVIAALAWTVRLLAASRVVGQQKTIEPDLAALAEGNDVQQQSFVGVAFHGVDGTTYDAIYFRPFNFRAVDPARRIHAVQYISHPTYTWQKLRTEQLGKFEQAVNPVPDPNAWFHVRVVVASPRVSVFVGDAKEPSLVVDQLSDRKKGLIGLWVGNNSGGDFANF